MNLYNLQDPCSRNLIILYLHKIICTIIAFSMTYDGKYYGFIAVQNTKITGNKVMNLNVLFYF